jgi:hypothetical protein
VAPWSRSSCMVEGLVWYTTAALGALAMEAPRERRSLMRSGWDVSTDLSSYTSVRRTKIEA